MRDRRPLSVDSMTTYKMIKEKKVVGTYKRKHTSNFTTPRQDVQVKCNYPYVCIYSLRQDKNIQKSLSDKEFGKKRIKRFNISPISPKLRGNYELIFHVYILQNLLQARGRMSKMLPESEEGTLSGAITKSHELSLFDYQYVNGYGLNKIPCPT